MSADVGYAAAVVVAAVYLVAGVAKLGDPRSTARTFRALGVPAAEPAARLVPLAEIALGAGLLVAPRPSAVAGLLLVTAFTALLASALRRGVRVGCGCFGSARHEPISFVELVRNGMLAVATAVALLAPSPRVPSLAAVVTVTAALAAAGVVLALCELHRKAGAVFSVSRAVEVR